VPNIEIMNIEKMIYSDFGAKRFSLIWACSLDAVLDEIEKLSWVDTV
tara:strand:+ start:105 stop:245 length:141 start_codon:yes stop_codon:yes gene_type:complete